MKRILFLFFITLSLCGFSQKEKMIFVKGIVINFYKTPIANVNISIVGSSKGTKTDVNGLFYLKIKQEETRLKISHINYYTKKKILDEGVVNDTLNTHIQLTQKINQLESFEITEEKIELLYKKHFVPIYDYKFYEDKLLLLVRELNVIKLRLINLNQEILVEETVPNGCENLFRDCFGNIHVTSSDSAYQLKIDLLKIDLIYGVDKKKFDTYLKSCVTEVNGVFIFKLQSTYNGSITYYFFDENKEIKYLKKIRNEVAVRNLVNRNAYVKQLEDPSISKMVEDSHYVRKARRLINKINFLDHSLKNMEDSPLFSIQNSVYIFDHVNDSCLIFDKNLEFEKSIPINYHNKQKWDKQKWSKKIIVDKEQGEVYAKFMKGGLCYLKKIDLNTGETVKSYKLEKHTYPINIKIKNNTAYYLYKDHFNNGAMSLFKQNLDE